MADRPALDAPKLDWALYWTDQGVSVHPLKVGSKLPQLPEWQERATDSQAMVKSWWREWPQANIGAVLKDRWLLCDWDLGTGGLETLELLERRYEPLPQTRRHISGRGGRHDLWTPNGHKDLRAKSGVFGPGGDAGAGPKNLVLPGSQIDEGGRYTIELDGPEIDLPEWLYQLWQDSLEGKLWWGSPYGAAALADELEQLRKTPEGQRHDRLYVAARNLGELVASGELDEEMVAVQLEGLAERECIDSDRHDPPGKAEATIRDGLEKGMANPRQPEPENAPKGRGPSQATELAAMARERYDFGQTDKGEPFAVAKDGPRLVKPLRGSRRSVRSELAALFSKRHEKVPTQAALTDALMSLEGQAVDEPQQAVHLRIARGPDDEIVIDLGDETLRVVVVRPGAWEVVDRSPVLFERTEAIGALPTPVQGGDVNELLSLVNIDSRSWPLLVAYLVHAFIPEIPHAVLLLIGEQGTGKSEGMRAFASLIDPSPAQLRSNPKDLRDWVVSALGSWVTALDNVSYVPIWLSDAICRAVSGDGAVTRALYSDRDLSVIAFRRVVMLNGIDLASMRGDLAERLVLIELERISDVQRRSDREIREAVAEARPRLFGALLDLLAETLQVLPTIHLDEHPRMADFAEVVAAVDQVRGTDALTTYLEGRNELEDQVVDSDPVASAVVKLMEALAEDEGDVYSFSDGPSNEWKGTPSELLRVLTQAAPDPRAKEWPKSARTLSDRLRRVAPALRTRGIVVDRGRTGQKRWVSVTRGDAE